MQPLDQDFNYSTSKQAAVLQSNKLRHEGNNRSTSSSKLLQFIWRMLEDTSIHCLKAHTHKKKGSEEDFLWTTARSLSVENDQWLMTLLLKQPTCYWCWEVDKQGGGLFLVLVEERQFLVDWNASDTTMGFKKGGNDAYLLFSVAD